MRSVGSLAAFAAAMRWKRIFGGDVCGIPPDACMVEGWFTDEHFEQVWGA